MKVLIAFIPNREKKIFQQSILPNGLYYLATYLKDRQVDVYLRNYSAMTDELIQEDIQSVQPDAIGIGCYTFNALSVFDFCKLVKLIDAKITTIVGGPHASALAQEILQRISTVDVIVYGEGEDTFYDIASGKVYKDIPGIWYREDDIKHTGPRPPIKNLDDMGIPAKHYPYHRIMTSRGCPGRCNFCSTPQLWGQQIRYRSPESVVEELTTLKEKYGLRFFIFSDDTFNANRKRAISICQLIIEKKLDITWDCRSRVNFIDEEQLIWMKKAGCVSISYGVESGSQRILQNVQKDISIEQVKTAAAATKKLGIQTTFFLIVGSPGENDESIQTTITLLQETRPHAILVSLMNLTPDIELSSFLPIDTWFASSEVHYYTKELPLEKLKQYGQQIREKFAQVQGYYTQKELVSMIKEWPSIAFTEFNHLGSFYLAQDMLDDALICFTKAVKLNPGYSQAINNIGVVLAKQDKKEDAVQAWLRAIRYNPEDTSAIKNLSKVYNDLGEYSKSQECERVLKILTPS